MTEPLTADQIEALKADPPEWLQRERATQAEARKEAARIKERNAQRAGDKTATERNPAGQRARSGKPHS